MPSNTLRHRGGFNRRQFGLGALALGAAGFAGLRPSYAQGAEWRAFAGTELRLLMVNHWWTDELRKYIGEFEELTGMKATLDVLAEDNYYQKAAVELAAGTGNYDALMVGNLQAGQYMAAKWLMPLDDLLGSSKVIDPSWYKLDDIFASGRAAGSSNDQLFALPISNEAEVVMYRTDLAEKAGITGIANLEDLVAAAEAMGGDGVSGIVGRGRRGLDVLWTWAGYLLSNGGDFILDGKAALNSEASKQAADLYLNKLLKAHGPQGTANMSWLESSGYFKDGNAALFTDASGLLTVALDPEKSAVREKVDVFAWPGQGSNAAAPNFWFWLFGVPANVRNADASALFMAWATSPELSLKIGTSAGSPVARQSVWDNPDFTAFYPGNSAAQIAQSLASVQPSRVPYADPRFPQIVDAISVDLVNILTGSADVDAAMENANAEVTRILGG